MTDPLTAPALAQALEEIADDLPKVGLLREGWYVQTLLTAAARLRSAETRPRCANCDHVEPHNGPAGDISDACTHPMCSCGFDSRPVPGETPAEPPQGRPTFEFSCPCCGDPFALTKELDVDIHSGATYRCALCDGKVIFDAIAADKYGAPPAVAPVAREIQQPQEPRRSWPDPTPEMLESDQFERVWQCIKRWDINVPDVYVGYMGANGNHVRAILEALAPPPSRDRETTMSVTTTNSEWVVIKVGDYATIAPPMLSPVEQHKRAVRVTFVTIWLMVAGVAAAAWWWL